MKFLCPSCKAKYQIADEKVAGRNVKMKCRKCGHLIHVNQAAAAPQSVLPAAPTPTAERDARASVPRGNVTPRAPEGRAPSSPRAAAPSSPRATAPSSPRATAPLGTAARAPAPRGSAPRAAAPPRATVPRAPLGASPRPSSPVGPAGRGAALGAAGSLGAAVAQSPAPTGASLRAVAEPEVPESVQADSAVDSGGDRASGVGSSPSSAPASGAAPASAGYGSYTEDEDEATVVASVGLAAALTRAMDEDPAPSSVLATDGEAEWYVGVAGAPEGPLTVPQLKERIAAGSVELETLVWKDGFDDWRPLSQFPELAAVVEEFRPSKPMGLGAPTPSPGPAAFNDAEDDLGFGALGFGQPRIGPNAPARPSQPEPSPVPPAPITGSEGIVTETRPSEIPLGLPKKHHNPAWQWLAVVAALGLGVTIGVVVWG
ncbi:MAG: zinc-ribbon domain-containing protein, partial [Myxococcales bacterium]|nr:zinc-ribbon domain-containing protein [Myxococcales bacterium]